MRAYPLDAARARVADLRSVFAVPAFRTYIFGNFAMTNGFWMQRIAVGWITWEATGSEAWLGLVAFAELFPSIFTALLGGALADRYPSPRVLFWGQVLSGLIALAFCLLHLTATLTPYLILALMSGMGAISGAVIPARLSMASWLVPKPLLPTALAVNSTSFNLSRFLGPAFAAGLLIAGSAALVFLVAAMSFAALSVALWRIRDVPRTGESRRTAPPAGMATVLRDVIATPAIIGIILLQLAQGMLVRPASELFPAYAEAVFQRGEFGLGALSGALGVGAVIGALALSGARETREAVRQIFTMSVVFAVSLIAFALTGTFWLALVILVVHGIAMSASNISALAFVQLNTAPERLGRVLSLYTIVFRVGPAVGAFLFGITAEATSLMATGIGCGIVALAVTAALFAFITRNLPRT
ncbi:MFS transporter [Algicella marina]|uniref:MFS transporter n=1 Tax=Algicella marina TaxID=2683284 RepID=A0A6P1SZL4_9RHOB|nr:MFS transporter [Algicella marina]QHQ35187.1 MFS transporter [Algicella marina]